MVKVSTHLSIVLRRLRLLSVDMCRHLHNIHSLWPGAEQLQPRNNNLPLHFPRYPSFWRRSTSFSHAQKTTRRPYHSLVMCYYDKWGTGEEEYTDDVLPQPKCINQCWTQDNCFCCSCISSQPISCSCLPSFLTLPSSARFCCWRPTDTDTAKLSSSSSYSAAAVGQWLIARLHTVWPSFGNAMAFFRIPSLIVNNMIILTVITQFHFGSPKR